MIDGRTKEAAALIHGGRDFGEYREAIDEALTLSTRMAVMGSKPGRIVQDIQNDLPLPVLVRF